MLDLPQDLIDDIKSSSISPDNWEKVFSKILDENENILDEVALCFCASHDVTESFEVKVTDKGVFIRDYEKAEEYLKITKYMTEMEIGDVVQFPVVETHVSKAQTINSERINSMGSTKKLFVMKVYENKDFNPIRYCLKFCLNSISSRDIKTTDTSDKLITFMKKLAPHIELALSYNVRSRMDHNGGHWLTKLLHFNNSPALILSSKGIIRYANPAAEKLLDAKDGIFKDIANGKLNFNFSHKNIKIEHLLEGLISGEDHGFKAISLQNEDGNHQVLNILTLNSQIDQGVPWIRLFEGRPQILVVMRNGEARSSVPPHLLEEAYALTKKEALLASALVDGKNLEEYANENGVKKETARWHLKQILQKTECRSQTDLVRRILYQFSVINLY